MAFLTISDWNDETPPRCGEWDLGSKMECWWELTEFWFLQHSDWRCWTGYIPDRIRTEQSGDLQVSWVRKAITLVARSLPTTWGASEELLHLLQMPKPEQGTLQLYQNSLGSNLVPTCSISEQTRICSLWTTILHWDSTTGSHSIRRGHPPDQRDICQILNPRSCGVW